MSADVAVRCSNVLGESPRWNDATQRLIWVDIESSEVWTLDPISGDVVTKKLADRVCCVTPCKKDKYLAAFARHISLLDRDFKEIASIPDSAPRADATRWNDGRCDRQGRFVVGSSEEGSGAKRRATVSRFAPDGLRNELISKVQVSNSVAFSLDGRTMYFADTLERCIWKYGYQVETGALTKRVQFCSLKDQPGWPDGSVVDSDDCLWNAQWGGGRVVRYTPNGKIDRIISLPTKNATSLTFGGEKFNTLFVTTATYGMSAAELGQDTLAGSLFAVDAHKRGIEETSFAL